MQEGLVEIKKRKRRRKKTHNSPQNDLIFVAPTSAGPSYPVLHVVPDPGLLGPGVDPAPGGVVPQGHAQHVGAQGPQLGGGDLRAQGRAEEEEGAGFLRRGLLQGQVRPQVEEGVAEDLIAIVCWNLQN